MLRPVKRGPVIAAIIVVLGTSSFPGMAPCQDAPATTKPPYLVPYDVRDLEQRAQAADVGDWPGGLRLTFHEALLIVWNSPLLSTTPSPTFQNGTLVALLTKKQHLELAHQSTSGSCSPPAARPASAGFPTGPRERWCRSGARP